MFWYSLFIYIYIEISLNDWVAVKTAVVVYLCLELSQND